MDRTSVTSSNIRSIGYDPRSKILEVEFTSGDIYQYFNIQKIREFICWNREIKTQKGSR